VQVRAQDFGSREKLDHGVAHLFGIDGGNADAVDGSGFLDGRQQIVQGGRGPLVVAVSSNVNPCQHGFAKTLFAEPAEFV